jgi:LEA14-like dessication related protein
VNGQKAWIILMSKKLLTQVAALMAGGAFVASACVGAFQRPDVRFEGMRVGGLGLRGGTVYAQLHVTNPNDFRLETTRLSYDLEVGDRAAADNGWSRLANGTFDTPIEVDANSSKVVEIPIEFNYSQMTGALRTILDKGTFDYRVSGVVRVAEPISRDVPYSRTGVVTMSGIR